MPRAAPSRGPNATRATLRPAPRRVKKAEKEEALSKLPGKALEQKKTRKAQPKVLGGLKASASKKAGSSVAVQKGARGGARRSRVQAEFARAKRAARRSDGVTDAVAPVLPDRPTSRWLIVDGQGRVLLFRFDYADGPLAGTAFWATPGGGCDPGETL